MIESHDTDLNKAQNDEVWVACVECNRATKHVVVFSVDLTHKYDGGDITEQESYQIIRCLGCETTSFRLSRASSEDFHIVGENELVYDERNEVYPPRAAGRPRLTDIHLLPYQVQYIYKETHKALCSDMRVLAAIGTRALVEAVCAEEGAEGGNLERKIDSLVPLGVLTKAGAEILHEVQYMGNAAAHEVRRHRVETLSTALDVVENLLQNVYILPKAAAKLKKRNESSRG